MDMRRTLPALLLAAMLPGCAWFGGDGDGPDEVQGDHFVVAVHNSGAHDVEVKMEVLEGGLLAHEESFTAPAGKTEERSVGYAANGTRSVRLTYTVDAGGRAASGTQEQSFDPADCPGVWRITFEVQPDEELTMVGTHAVCDARA